MGPVVVWLCFALVLIHEATSTYKTAAGQDEDVGRVCPAQCNCLVNSQTAQCSFRFSEFSLERISGWKILKLEIFGDNAVKSEDIFPLFEENEGLPSLSHLLHLELFHMVLSAIPANAFISAKRLQTLQLSNNAIANIDRDAFSGLKELKLLNLSSNYMYELKVDVFRDLNNLEVLDLSHNSLKHMPENIFVVQQHLTSLYLQHNLLTDVQFLDTSVLVTLKKLDLQDNLVSYIRPNCVENLRVIPNILLKGNPLDCTCAAESLILGIQSNHSNFDSESLACATPIELKGRKLKEVDLNEVPCLIPAILEISPQQDILYQDSLHLECKVTGTPYPALYWIAPWGHKFAPFYAHSELQDHIADVTSSREYWGTNHLLLSHVHVSDDGTLHVDKFRGYFAGNYKCVAQSFVGNATEEVQVKIHSMMTEVEIMNYMIGGGCAGGMLVIAIIIGLTRMAVNKCMKCCTCCNECACCCDCCFVEDEKGIDGEEKFQEEIVISVSDFCEPGDESGDYYDDESSPPKTPFNSPLYHTPRMSPMKCPTPNGENPEDRLLSTNILESLEEVRARLRLGVGRRMRKVRHNVRSMTEIGAIKMKHIKETGTLKIQSIKESGSNKIQSIKETSSNAASRVKAGVAMGMQQVKYSVQSVKEFCGTGDMGEQTISTISVSTDIDTDARVEIVQSHTFV